MDGARLQRLIYQKGYGKAVDHVGTPYSVYRPTGVITPAPISDATLVGVQNAHFRVDDSLTQFQNYGKPVYRGWFDATKNQLFDYLVGFDGTFLLVGMQSLLPLMCVWCNRVVNYYEPAATGLGAQPYNGVTKLNQVLVAQGWPASILEATKRSTGDIMLPGDSTKPYWRIILPPLFNTKISNGGIFTDDLNNRYIVSGAELTPYGWRSIVQQAMT